MATQSSSSAAAQTSVPWVDGKRYLWLMSPFVPIIALAFLALAYYNGGGIALFGMFSFFYILLPILDTLIGTDANNPPKSAIANLEEDRYYRWIVYAYIPLQYAVTIFGALFVATHDLSWWEYIGTIFTVGVVNGVAINTAHELGHKKPKLERWLSKITLAPVAYGHFYVEHNKGHHRWVATPNDPASSRMGESFWSFLPRTVIGSAKSAWNIEKDRLARRNQSVWNKDNDNLQAWGMTLVLFALLTVWLGWIVLPFLIIQAAYGASLLEVVNYLEHYGLLRPYDKNKGRYMPCEPEHSWNSNNIITNLFLYQLQRHSDHHANPTRRYQSLRHFDESPELPSGYATMLTLAYFPPIWFKIMDHRVAAHYKGDLTLANLQPSKREKLLKRWQTATPKAETDALIESRSDSSSISAVSDTSTQAGNYTDYQAKGDGSQHQCPNCGYLYDPAMGNPDEGFEAGTRWDEIPASWACPGCAVRDKADFLQV